MKILFLVPYPEGAAPSQRFRFEQYFGIMREKGIDFHVSSFLDQKTWSVLYEKGNTATKITGILKGFLRRIKNLFQLSGYNYVFIHREATPLGPPVFEWLIAKVFSKKIIYDFDDAIWLPNVSENNRFFSKIKWYSKVKSICRWSHMVSCGNDYLKEFALQHNTQVIVNPTVVNTEHHYNKLKKHQPGKTVIGWTGTHTTAPYVDELLPVLRKLEERFDIETRIISNAPVKLPLKNLHYVTWKKTTEIEDLLAFDIGLMPLTDDDWTRGKCGFKLIQYLALGIPAVTAPVGVNSKIVDNGLNGYLCRSEEEWLNALAELITGHEIRKHFGEKGRQKIISHFSVTANSPLFLMMFA